MAPRTVFHGIPLCDVCNRLASVATTQGAFCTEHAAQQPLQRYASASKLDRINRLRERVRQAKEANPEDPIAPIMLGLLDLLEAEL
jgi:hypothetical protein